MARDADSPGHGAAKCGAARRQGDGAPCTRTAGWGTDHPGVGRCKFHGGSTPSHRAAGALKLVEMQAQQALAKSDLAPVTDPLSALAQVAAEVLRWKDIIGERVGKLESYGYQGLTGEQIRAEVQLWERALDRCERFLGTMAKLAIDERLARVTELQRQMIVRALEAGLAAAGVAGPAAIEAKAAAAKQLRVAA